MKNLKMLLAITCALVCSPAMAQTRLNSVNGPGPTFAYPGMTYTAPGGNTYYRGITPYPTYSPYGYGYNYGYGGYPGTVYGVPTILNNGFYRFNLGPVGVNMWRSPSGYYYPWCGGYPGGYATSTTILYAPQATSAPQPQLPPISTMVRDMLSYLDESKEKGRLDEGDYNHLRQRVIDLQSKESLLMSNSNGSMDPQDEQQLRADLDSVSREITQRIKPVK